MKVRCIYKNYRDVKPSLYRGVAALLKNSYFYPHQSRLNLELGKEYEVFGVIKQKISNKIEYLIVDETNLPDFYLAELFEITDSRLPIADWHFMVGNKYHVASYLFGYEEFVNNSVHFENIILHEDDVKSPFQKWRDCVSRLYLKPEDEWETIDTSVEGVNLRFMRNKKSGELKNFQFVF
jgi:hypothetical protein